MAVDIVFLGGPGAGKGTQAQILQKHFGYRQISTGDLLRTHKKNGTELGKAAEGYMTRGDLVPDDLIIKMVEGELGDDAALFDGFPRTVAQAKALDELLTQRGRGVPGVVYFQAPRAILEERLLGRWTNPRTGRVYHEKFNPPHVPGICDEDGGPLEQRPDDKAEIIKKRLDVFEAETMPLVAFYEANPERFVAIDATQDMDDVTHELLHVIGVAHAH